MDIEKNYFIKSPINYTGNKYRILDQITTEFPKDCDTFVDLFCGGATVGFNVNYKNIILIDNNIRVISLLETLASSNIDLIINNIENIINKYGLSYSRKYTYKYYRDLGYVEGNNGLKKFNLDGYYKLKDDYNKLKNKDCFLANIMLYVLMAYGFNNDIRFNNDGEFNLPVGKTDFNNNNYNKLIEFNERAKKINYKFICGDFRDKKIFNIISKANFVYCDPPYLITKAVYNENNGWTNEDEIDLLNLLLKLNSLNIKFVLSNVIKKKGVKNKYLIDFVEKNSFNIKNIKYHYRSSNYHKIDRAANEKEVIVYND